MAEQREPALEERVRQAAERLKADVDNLSEASTLVLEAGDGLQGRAVRAVKLAEGGQDIKGSYQEFMEAVTDCARHVRGDPEPTAEPSKPPRQKRGGRNRKHGRRR